MKDYMKPEVEVIDFAAEVIMFTDDMGGSVVDGDGSDPRG